MRGSLQTGSRNSMALSDTPRAAAIAVRGSILGGTQASEVRPPRQLVGRNRVADQRT
jgi:hypothetical protein